MIKMSVFAKACLKRKFENAAKEGAKGIRMQYDCYGIAIADKLSD